MSNTIHLMKFNQALDMDLVPTLRKIFDQLLIPTIHKLKHSLTMHDAEWMNDRGFVEDWLIKSTPYIIYKGETLIGMCRLGGSAYTDTCTLSDFVIDEDHRGKGYGKTVLHMIKEIAVQTYAPKDC